MGDLGTIYLSYDAAIAFRVTDASPNGKTLRVRPVAPQRHPGNTTATFSWTGGGWNLRGSRIDHEASAVMPDPAPMDKAARGMRSGKAKPKAPYPYASQTSTLSYPDTY